MILWDCTYLCWEDGSLEAFSWPTKEANNQMVVRSRRQGLLLKGAGSARKAAVGGAEPGMAEGWSSRATARRCVK